MSEAAASDYLRRLPLSGAERNALATVTAAPRAAPGWFAGLHESLGGAPAPELAPPLASLRWRLLRVLGPEGAGLVHDDPRGRVRLATTPPLKRSRMVAPPLRGSGLGQIFRKLLRARGKNGPGSVSGPPPAPREPWQDAAVRRRALFLLLVAAQTAGATALALAVLPYHGRHWLELPVLALQAILVAWVSAGFWMALMGFWVLIRGGDRHAIPAHAPLAPIPPEARTAILIPVYNENVRRVFAGLLATHQSLAATGALARFDFFVLSDSTDPDARVAELEAWLALCRAVDGFGHVFYRRRHRRTKRKAGNIADWCRRWGAAYRYMVVLDADSVMSGDCLVRLVQLMEAHPRAGIIQTLPMATGRDTLYARVQQFAHRVYGPLFTAGLHFWHLGEAYYWGHNAILRVEPFIRHCALPRIEGSGPLSGEILSHDFVEAALMRRAGWQVWVAHGLPGSWEEMPPTLLEELRRDRRWCQGNLQHSRLFLAQGLHPAHRALFMAGVMSYVSALLWFAFLALSTALLAVHVLAPPAYFGEQYQLFPLWPEWHPDWALGLFAGMALLLLLPKLLAAALVAVAGAHGFGGRLKLAAGVLLEIGFSALLAPIRMLFHARFVVLALAGAAVHWLPPPRENTETAWTEAVRLHGGGTVLGVAWAAFAAWLNPAFLGWLLPIAGSLIAAIPLSVWSSRVRAGLALRRSGLFVTPEESAPPPELQVVAESLGRFPQAGGAFRRAVVDPGVNALACGAARAWRRQPEHEHNRRLRLCQQALERGAEALGPDERNVLLGDALMLSRLHHRVWSTAAPHGSWRAPASAAGPSAKLALVTS